ncbi:MAG: hypothetical protein INR71_06865, partial [Terriglobus roseus]|nr:hypothetical protein [Terriglobus roseus]
YHGHSWAKGLFESGDGKDQESTSEDAFASYALKMWGKVSRDDGMDARGSIMLAIQARSFRHYFLMESDNVVQPPEFIGNKVTGILFENKVDHATYFGANIEYIEGIHMIPLSPALVSTRGRKFGRLRVHRLCRLREADGGIVKEEWNTYFSNGRVNQAGGGWRGLIYANLALVDAVTAFNFFNQANFDAGWLDGGASRCVHKTRPMQPTTTIETDMGTQDMVSRLHSCTRRCLSRAAVLCFRNGAHAVRWIKQPGEAEWMDAPRRAFSFTLRR